MGSQKEEPRKNPLRIVDTTFRDGHQSALATRMRTEDMEPIAAEMDKAGFYALEVWGGATFDVTHRFLNEDPWDRPRVLKKLMPQTPFQMLLRGQNLVGYRNYPDDVVRAFVHHAAEVGIDIFRIFDAVNDERNFIAPLKAVKECGKHAQLTICYSLTEPRMGGPVYNLDFYINKAKIMQDMGADSLCIKDMAGLVSPYDAFDLIKALKKVIKIPIDLHTHYTSGMGSMTYLKAAEAGVDIVDTALAPFALRSSQPAIEPLLVALQGTDRDTGLNLDQLLKAGQFIESIAPKYRDFLGTTGMSVIDTNVLKHQIPGGMLSNLVAQLKEAGALDRLQEVYKELPRVRKELGYPPLVTPTSQIVGIQAVQNVLFGRYKMVSSQVKDYVYGLYGKPPAPIDPEVQKIVLKGYERGEQPITGRAADILEPEMEKAKEATKGLARNEGDVLIYAIYPTTGLRFLKWKYGLEAPPAEVKAKTAADIKREDELMAKARAGKLVEKAPEKPKPEKSASARAFNVFVDGEYYKVEVDPGEGAPRIAVTQPKAQVAAAAPVAKAAPAPAPAPAAATKAAPAAVSADDEGAVTAPMPGLVIKYEVKEGDRVKAGDIVLILEAMKMQNSIPAPIDGVVKSITKQAGATVSRGEVLAVIVP
ncbi:MAG: pyruvate carboxylase subunit B [Dehalococcoidia bacterium]|nr:pyruvate carboxylase subunit B [Dehalococcoidia bacterium]